MTFKALKFHWEMYHALPKQDKICSGHSCHILYIFFISQIYYFKRNCLPEFFSMFTIYDRVKGNLKVKLSPVGN